MAFGLDFPGYFNAVGNFLFGNSPKDVSARKAFANKDSQKYDPLISPVADPILDAVGLDDAMSGYSSAKSGASGPTFKQLTADRSSGSSAKSLDYLNADLARYYGMDAGTAYQEALSNTAYQRAVKDMQSAGLNPAALFGAGRASTADGVSYVSQASSGSGGFSRARGGSAKSRFVSSSGYGALVNLAGLAGLALTKGRYTGYLAGSTAAKGVLSFFDSLR